MCMKGIDESCILLERMAKVEAKQNIILSTVVLMFLVVAFMAIKLLNTQIFLLTGNSGSVAFFKLAYDGIASEDIKVVFRSPATFEGGLYLRGEDNVLYKITINAGTITATEVEGND